VALATGINGNIRKSALSTLSPVNGLLMKSDSGEVNSVGTALEDLNTKNAKM